MKRRNYSSALCTAVAACALIPRAAIACATVINGPDMRITQESAVILWDESRHTEHFIRRATFDTKASDFGFLVPTPNTPELREADPVIFTHLDKLMEPGQRDETKYVYDWSPFTVYGTVQSFYAGTTNISTSINDVDVVTTTQIAGLQAVVLRADDAKALGHWLKRNGYPSTPELIGWLRPYIRQGWKITAFKIAKQGKAGAITGNLVRMSFKADHPFYPYSEPLRQMRSDEDGRQLKVYLLAPRRMDGFIGASKTQWPGRVTWAGEVAAEHQPDIATDLNLSPDRLPPHFWMTAFEDDSSPRIGTADVNFQMAVDQNPILTAPIVSHYTVYIPMFWICCLVCGGVYGIYVVARKRVIRVARQ